MRPRSEWDPSAPHGTPADEVQEVGAQMETGKDRPGTGGSTARKTVPSVQHTVDIPESRVSL